MTEVIFVKRENLVKTIGENQFCSITFTKKNGEVRRLVGRLGVKRHLKGKGKNYSDEDKGLVTVFDTQKGEYRSIRANSILSVKAHGKEYRPLEDE